MIHSRLEHINFTVSNPLKTAELFTNIFGWKIRWSGESKDSGFSVHVGEPNNGQSYLALYSPKLSAKANDNTSQNIGFINHIGILVSDLDLIEEKLKNQGIETLSHADYDPGKRFYFFLEDNIEVEVISYASTKPKTKPVKTDYESWSYFK